MISTEELVWKPVALIDNDLLQHDPRTVVLHKISLFINMGLQSLGKRIDVSQVMAFCGKDLGGD